MKKICILGAKGMLGQALVEVFQSDYEVTAWDYEDIDVTDARVLEEALTTLQPETVINATAYNAVDLCETGEAEYAKAVAMNVSVPETLAKLSQKLHFVLVHYSTDYVFDGEKSTGYLETDAPNPLSRYGMTKWEGEKEIMENAQKFYLIRLSKLFGKPASSVVGKRSFFDVMLEKARKGESLTVVNGERSCFTYAPDLAEATRLLIEDSVSWGIYHLTNRNPATWYEAALELFRLAHLEPMIEPVAPETFPRPAKRPAFSALLNTKRPHLRPFSEALQEHLDRMVQ